MNKKSRKIKVNGSEITVLKSDREDFISLTDIARHKNPEATGLVISHWLSTRYTIEFMVLWEKMHNPDFNVTEFRNIRNESGSNGFVLSGKNWINSANAIGIISRAGRYGGTYAIKENLIPSELTPKQINQTQETGKQINAGQRYANARMGSSLCLTLDDKREELNIDFVLSKESFEA